MNFLAMIRRYLLPLSVAATYLFLYIPIVVLILFSFNRVAFPYRWVGFSLRWYKALLESPEIWSAFTNSLIVATAAVFLSLLFGLMFVFYGRYSQLNKWLPLFYAGLLIPELVVAVSLLLFFIFFTIPLGLSTLIVGHTLLGLAYSIPILSERLAAVDSAIIEASLDLGASLNQTFYLVIIPMLMPALGAAGLLTFIISFDDFLISFFCAGTSAQTLPLYIFAMIRTGVDPTINALSTLLLLVSSLCVLIFVSFKTKVRLF